MARAIRGSPSATAIQISACTLALAIATMSVMVSPIHKVPELHPATAFVVLADDVAGADIERGEQGRGAMSLVIMRLANHRPAVRQLQVSLGTLQRLDR